MGLFSRKNKKTNDNIPARRRRNYDNRATDTPRISPTAFKSGRTLAGTTRSRLKSTERTAVKTATPREKLHHLTYIRKRIAWIFAGFVIICIMLAILLWQFTASVLVQAGSVTVIAQNNLDEYAKTIQQYLSDNPTERLRFNLNEGDLNEFLVRQHPEVASVTQGDAAGFTKTRFVVNLRKPVVGWQVDSVQYFVDSQGVSFTKNIYDNPSVIIVDNSGVKHTPGTAIASARFLGFVGRAVAAMQDRGLVVERVTIPAGTSRQIEATIKDVPYPFILSIDRSPNEQAEDIQRVIGYFGRSGVVPRYVDVRVKGKAFYRD